MRRAEPEDLAIRQREQQANPYDGDFAKVILLFADEAAQSAGKPDETGGAVGAGPTGFRIGQAAAEAPTEQRQSKRSAACESHQRKKSNPVVRRNSGAGNEAHWRELND